MIESYKPTVAILKILEDNIRDCNVQRQKVQFNFDTTLTNMSWKKRGMFTHIEFMNELDSLLVENITSIDFYDVMGIHYAIRFNTIDNTDINVFRLWTNLDIAKIIKREVILDSLI